jgi:peptide/nickel transport system permease protein
VAAFIGRRALSGVTVIAVLLFLTFFVFNTIPTNPACLVVACGPHSGTTDAEIRAVDHRLGIDRPVVVQFGTFAWDLVHGDLGVTWTTQQQVFAVISRAAPVTASLIAGGMIVTLLLSLSFGSFAASHPKSVGDRTVLVVSAIGLAIHPFVLAILLERFFAHRFGSPSGGYCPIFGGRSGCSGLEAWASHLVVPWIVFGLLFLPLYTRMVRARLLETSNESWVSTARAKGASERRVLLVHSLPNAVAPILPMVAIDAGTALTAAIYIETVFGLPGLGQLAVRALSGEAGGYDLPLTAGLVVTVGVFVIGLNILADIGGAWIDPRLRVNAVRAPSQIAGVVSSSRVRLAIGLAVTLVLLAIASYQLALPRGDDESALANSRTFTANFFDRFALAGEGGDAITTRVTRVVFGPASWRVYATVKNEGGEAVEMYQPPAAVGYPNQGFSLVISPSTRQRSAGLRQFTVEEADTFTPALPRRLGPGESWSGSFGGSDAVTRGQQVFVGFGAFFGGKTSQPVSGTTERAIVTR